MLLASVLLVCGGCAGMADEDEESFNQHGQAVTAAVGDGWYGMDLGGSVPLGGSSMLQDGVFTVSGGGGDLWASQDDGHFVFRPVSGDFDLIARVSSYSGDTSNVYCKGALVFKEAVEDDGGEPGAQAAGVYQTLNHGADDYWYVRDGGGFISSYNSDVLNSYGQGGWLRMTREGDTFRSYHFDSSSASWVQHGGDRLVSINTDGYLGFAVTSANPNTLATVTFEDVMLQGGTTDMLPPQISNVTVTRSNTSAYLAWSTDEPATSVVDYGKSWAYGNQQSNVELMTEHGILLSGLSPLTQYRFRIQSTDAASNTSAGVTGSFTTKLLPDLIPPLLYDVQINATDTSASISWQTSELATSVVEYGPLLNAPVQVNSASMVSSHSLQLTDLTPATLYHLRIQGQDIALNLGLGINRQFTTDPAAAAP